MISCSTFARLSLSHRPPPSSPSQLLFAHFDVGIFTASQREVAVAKVEWLEDRVGHAFHAKHYRDACTPCCGVLVKDLRSVAASLHEVVLVEDLVFAGGFTPDNVCPIKQWNLDHDDDALPPLGRFLVEKIAPAHDVRTVLRTSYDLRARAAAARPPPQACALLRSAGAQCTCHNTIEHRCLERCAAIWRPAPGEQTSPRAAGKKRKAMSDVAP